MFSAGGALLRADLRGVVEEAFLLDQSFIGAKACPPLPVPNMAGQYPVLKKLTASLLRNDVKMRGPGAEYARVSRAWENDNYTCQEYGIEEVIDDSERDNISRFFSLEESTTRHAYRAVQLAHELRVSSLLFNTSTFGLTTSTTPYTNANRSNFDIGLDIDAAKQQIQSRGEDSTDLTVVMSLNNFLRARGSTQLQNRIRGTIGIDTQLILTPETFADALEVKQVLVGRAAYDKSNAGAPAVNMVNIWSDAYIWVGKVTQPTGPEQFFGGGTAYTLFWEQDSDIFQVEEYREERKRSSVIRSRQFTDEKVVLAPSAQLLVTQYS